jgi:hypothetical protein
LNPGQSQPHFSMEHYQKYRPQSPDTASTSATTDTETFFQPFQSLWH